MIARQWLAAFTVLTSALGAQAAPAKYVVDKDHTKVQFTVRHLMISEVTGRFKDFTGDFVFDPEKGTLGDANFIVQAASVDTDNAKRDDHLRSPDFFDVKKYPTLTVTNSKLAPGSGKNKFKWTGDLTIHGVTKPVVFDLDYIGSIKDPWGMERAGFTATAKINRKDFGLKWNKALESGGVVVGDEVTIRLDAEGVKQADAKGTNKAKK